VELRTIVQELIDYQLNDYQEEAIAQKQRELNVAYDRFADQYGLINSRANAQAFSEDSSYYLLCSLENVDENGRLESKADMFTKRTIRPERAVTSVDTPAEDIYNVTTEELKNSQVSPEVMAAFDERHAVLRSCKKTAVDHVAGHIALTFELVYPISLQIAKERGYLDKMMAFESDNEVTGKQFEEIRAKLNEYVASVRPL